jgi:hypothetical protein
MQNDGWVRRILWVADTAVANLHARNSGRVPTLAALAQFAQNAIRVKI